MVRKNALLIMTLLLGIVLGQEELWGAQQAPDIKTKLGQLEGSLGKLKGSLKYLKKGLISLSINMLPDESAEKARLIKELNSLNIQLQTLEAEKKATSLKTALSSYLSDAQKESAFLHHIKTKITDSPTIFDKIEDRPSAEGESLLELAEQIPLEQQISELTKIITLNKKVKNFANDPNSLIDSIINKLINKIKDSIEGQVATITTGNDLAKKFQVFLTLSKQYNDNKNTTELALDFFDKEENILRELDEMFSATPIDLEEFKSFLEILDASTDYAGVLKKENISQALTYITELITQKNDYQTKQNDKDTISNYIQQALKITPPDMLFLKYFYTQNKNALETLVESLTPALAKQVYDAISTIAEIDPNSYKQYKKQIINDINDLATETIRSLDDKADEAQQQETPIETLKAQFQNLDENTTVLDKAKELNKTSEEMKQIISEAIKEEDAIKELNKILTKTSPLAEDSLTQSITSLLVTQALNASEKGIEQATEPKNIATLCFNLIQLHNNYEKNKTTNMPLNQLDQDNILRLIEDNLQKNEHLDDVITYQNFLENLRKQLKATSQVPQELSKQVEEDLHNIKTYLDLKRKYDSNQNNEDLYKIIKAYIQMNTSSFTKKFAQISSEYINQIITKLSNEQLYKQIKLYSEKDESDLSKLIHKEIITNITNKAYPHVAKKFSEARTNDECGQYFKAFATIIYLNQQYKTPEKINNFLSQCSLDPLDFSSFLHQYTHNPTGIPLQKLIASEEIKKRIENTRKLASEEHIIEDKKLKFDNLVAKLKNIIEKINTWSHQHTDPQNIEEASFQVHLTNLQELSSNKDMILTLLNKYKPEEAYKGYFYNYLNTQYVTINITILPPQITETNQLLTLVPILRSEQWEKIKSPDPIIKAVKKTVLENKNPQEVKKAFTKAKEKVKANKQAEKEGKTTQKTMSSEDDDDDDDDDEPTVETTTLSVDDLVKPDKQIESLFDSMIRKMKSDYLQGEEITAQDDTQSVQRELSALVQTFIKLYEKEEANKWIAAHGQETVKEAEKIKKPWETEEEEEEEKPETRANLLARKKSIEEGLAQLSGEATNSPYTDDEISAFEKEIEDQKKEIAKLENKLKKLEVKNIEDEIEDKKEKLERNINILESLINNKEGNLRIFQLEKEKIEKEIQLLQADNKPTFNKTTELSEKKAKILNTQAALNAEQTRLESLQEELKNLLGENATTFMQKSIEEEKEKLNQEIEEEQETLQKLERELEEIKNPNLSQDAYKKQAEELIKGINAQLKQLPSEEEIRAAEETLDKVRKEYNIASKQYKNLMITFISSIGNNIKTANNQNLLEEAIKPLFNVYMEYAQNSNALPFINEISDPRGSLPILLNLTPHTLPLEAFYQAIASIKDHINTTLPQPPLVSSPETSNIKEFYKKIINAINEIIDNKIANLENRMNNASDAQAVATILQNIFITKRTPFFDIYLTYHLKYQLTKLILTQQAIVTTFLSKYRSSTGTKELLSMLDIINEQTRNILEDKILEGPAVKDSDAHTILTRGIEDLEDTSKGFE